jgi:hypothetical protein
MTIQAEQVAHSGLVGGGEIALHSHAGSSLSVPGLCYGLIKDAIIDRRYPAGAGNTSALGTAGVGAVANALRVFPFIPPMDVTADILCCWISTLLAGNNIKLGIWSANGVLYPSTLLASGEIDTSTTGLKNIVVSVVMTAGNLYWIGYVLNTVTTLAFRKLAVGAYISLMGLSSASTPVYGIGWTVAHTYANALPNPYTPGGTILAAITDMVVAIRVV